MPMPTLELNVKQLDICVDKFDCYHHQDKCIFPLKNSEPNVSENHLRTNIDNFYIGEEAPYDSIPKSFFL